MSIAKKTKGTRFIWKIENFSFLENGELKSPWFKSHSTKWEVGIYPYENNDENLLDFELHQNEYKAENFNCSLAFIDSEGSTLMWKEKKDCQTDYFNSLLICTLSKDTFGIMKEKLLPNDNLTVECRIWKTDEELIQVKSYFARTHIEPISEVIEKTFTFTTPGINSFLSQIKESENSVARYEDKVNTTLFFDDEEEIQAKITHNAKSFSRCKISLLDAMGKLIQFSDEIFDFDTKGCELILHTNITRAMLRCNQDKFLPNDTLTLAFELSFLCEVAFSRMGEKNEMYFNDPKPPANDPSLTSAEPESNKLNENTKELEPSKGSNPPVTINQVLWSMYEEGFMSDFSLGVGNKTFPVHKAVLGVRSPVFRAMFTADMKEKESGSVVIEDVDADTIQRMLKFVYCDSVQEDMGWESASSLYAAADKYALEPLKQKCSDILKCRLSVSRVLAALLLATIYQDRNLETAALEFIERNDKFIIGTQPWCKFEEDNPLIAIDVFRKLYVKKMNG